MSDAARTTLRRGLAAAGALIALVPAAPAAAQRANGAFFPGAPVDGPSPDVRALGDADVARDGDGAIAYVRRDGGEDHAFVSLVQGGVPTAPVRVDPGQGPLIGRPSLAAGNGGRLAVAFVNPAGAWVALRAAAGQPFGAPQQLGGPGARDVVVDMAFTGVAYAAWSENGDMRAAYLPRLGSAFQGYAAPLDADPARDAGGWAGSRPRIATAADAVGVVAWGERGADGVGHVVARRLVRERLSVVATEANAAAIDGIPAGSADSPDVGFEDVSSFAWVVFRQTVAGGTVRGVARRLRGSGFDDPVAFDGAPPAGEVGEPRVAVNGRGAGIAALPVPGGLALGAVIRDDAVTAPQVLGVTNGTPGPAAAAFAENFDGLAAWMQAPAGGAEVRARILEDDLSLPSAPPFGPETLLSDPQYGPVDPDAGLDADVSRAGDALVAFVHDAGGDARRLAVAVYDRAPGLAVPTTTTNWGRRSRPTLAWAPSFDVWGGVSYQVLLDGQPIGTTTATRLVPTLPIPDGLHRWQVVAADRRGQVSRSSTRNLRIDATPPGLEVGVSGERRAGKRLKFSVTASDLRSPAGSDLRQVRIDYGDKTLPRVVDFRKMRSARSGTRRARGRAGGRRRARKADLVRRTVRFTKVFRRGTFRVRVSARDNAGNASVVRRSIVVKAPKRAKKPAKR